MQMQNKQATKKLEILCNRKSFKGHINRTTVEQSVLLLVE